MLLRYPVAVSLFVPALAGGLFACSGSSASRSPAPAGSKAVAPHSSQASERQERDNLIPLRQNAATQAGPETFTGSLQEAKELIGYYHSIRLTPEQEKVKAEALSGMTAPCCARYSLATCCCPCNLAKAAWGLAARLIANEGMDAKHVRAAEASWLKHVDREGFTGDACFTGGCGRPMHANGCGGMNEGTVVF